MSKISNDIKPTFRFKNFTDDWIKVKLFEIFEERKVKKKISKDFPLLAFAAGQGVINRSERRTNNRDFLTKDSSKKKYLLTLHNDIVYNPSNLKYGAIDRNKYGQGLISPIYVTFETSEVPSFLELIVKSEKFKQRALQYEEGTVVKRQSVKPESLLSLSIKLPSNKSEQKLIGNLFERLDENIDLNKHALSLLKQRKKAFLQKMFPIKGKSIPELRFKEFNDKWLIDKFDDLVIKVSEKSKSNTLPKVEFEDIVSGEGRLNKDISKKFDNRKGTLFEPNYILFGKLRPYLKNWLFTDFHGVALGDFWVLKPIKINPLFLYYLIQTEKYQTVANLSSGTKMPRSNWKTVSETKFYIPSKVEEQEKIGNFFKELDNSIALQEEKLETLKKMKKAFLQKMFV